MRRQCVLRSGVISADWGWVLNLDLRQWLARFPTNQLLTGGLYLHLGGTQQVRRGRLLLHLLQLFWRRGRVIDLREGVERRRCCCNRRREREGRDRWRRSDNWNHWDDGNGDLRWKRGGRRLMGLVMKPIISPSDVVCSDWLRQWGHKFHTFCLCLPVDEVLLFPLLFLCKKCKKMQNEVIGLFYKEVTSA